MRSRLRVVLVALSLCLPTFAQAPTPQPERRTFAVSVLDKDGNAVHGLTTATFRGTYRGQPVKILSATEDSSPRRIAILLDASQSMESARKAASSAAQDAISNLAPDHTVALMTFGGLKGWQSPFSHDKQTLLQALSQAEARARSAPERKTPLFDSVIFGIRHAWTPEVPDVVYVISDCTDNASVAGSEDVARVLAHDGVRAMILWFKDAFRPDRRKEASNAHILCGLVAEASGGLMLEVDKNSGDKIPTPILNATIHTYSLEVEFGRPVENRSEWKLEVISQSGKLGRVDLSYPHLLVPLNSK